MNLNAISPVIFFSVVLTGCSDPFAGYDDKDPGNKAHAKYTTSSPWLGKCVRFESPMVYVTSPPKVGYEVIKRVGPELSKAEDADYLHGHPDFKNMVITPVSPGTTFGVTAVFTVVHTGLSSFFNTDFEVAVLRDSRGQVSTTLLSELKPCN